MNRNTNLSMMESLDEIQKNPTPLRYIYYIMWLGECTLNACILIFVLGVFFIVGTAVLWIGGLILYHFIINPIFG